VKDDRVSRPDNGRDRVDRYKELAQRNIIVCIERRVFGFEFSSLIFL